MFHIPTVPRKWFGSADWDTIYTFYQSLCTHCIIMTTYEGRGFFSFSIEKTQKKYFLSGPPPPPVPVRLVFHVNKIIEAKTCIKDLKQMKDIDDTKKN